jgi:hypothetical protein
MRISLVLASGAVTACPVLGVFRGATMRAAVIAEVAAA